MHGRGKSDSPGVSRKPPNKAAEPAAEAGERRGLAEGNSLGGTTPRTQRRAGVSSALDRVRQAARQDRQQRFTALLHHVYAIERLRAAYEALNPRASAGIDGETWAHYGQALERTWSEVGAVQGGSISPLLANLYLHYVFDRWVQRWRQTQATGDVIVVRFADDCAPRRRREEAWM